MANSNVEAIRYTMIYQQGVLKISKRVLTHRLLFSEHSQHQDRLQEKEPREAY